MDLMTEKGSVEYHISTAQPLFLLIAQFFKLPPKKEKKMSDSNVTIFFLHCFASCYVGQLRQGSTLFVRQHKRIADHSSRTSCC